MQYSILIYGAEGVFEQLSEKEQEAIMQGHYALQGVLAARGEFATAKLMPTSGAVTLQPTGPENNSKPIVRDGPFAETKERLLGFYTAECQSLDDAIALAEHLASPYVKLEIRPISWAGGLLDPE